MSQVLLSFDVEEFDMPLEYQQQISLEEQLQVGKQGLDAVMQLLQKQNIVATHFTTANFANHFPDAIKQLSIEHEIASHTYYHSAFEDEHLLQSRLAVEAITGKQVFGLRMPRMKVIGMDLVQAAGYTYDSSINPTWLPGRYNNLNKPRTIYYEEEMLRLPASVSPMLRLPLFWLGFKNYPYPFFLHLCRQCLRKDGYVCLYFHPWEFTNLSNYQMPSYTKKPDSETLLHRLDKLITDLKKDNQFTTIQNFLQTKKPAV
jgi:peptidoglycan/xylan/chitin deacetylase (PgdA/CDA1 family)